MLIPASSTSIAGDRTEVEDGLLTPLATSPRSIAVTGSAQLWQGGIIPYTIDASLSKNSHNVINRAIDHWNNVGGISLLPVSEVQRRTGNVVKDSVRFVTGEHCASWVGKRGGQQDLWVAPNCPVGSVMHEIGHLLGLEHEHTRPDRDLYIQINWENIKPDKRHNFETAPAGSRLPGSYDLDSIMHYGSHNFSSNGLSTITPLDGSVGKIGQRLAPSVGDLQAVAELYGSDLSVVARTANVEAGAELDIYISNHTLMSAHDVTIHVNTELSVVFADVKNDHWSCVDAADGAMMCTSHWLPGGAVEHLRASLPEFHEAADIDVQLSSKTPDSDLSNNSSQVVSDEVSEPPPGQPELEPDATTALSDESVAQEDAVARVALGGGAVGTAFIVVLLLFVGQASSRVDQRQPIII